ncbi:MAG: hypothetical protein V5A72_00095 [Candidatus Nanohaloarchaea archaeon]
MVRDDLEERKESDFEVDEGLTIGEFLDNQGIEVLVSRAGKIVSETAELEPEDLIEVFDVIAGG